MLLSRDCSFILVLQLSSVIKFNQLISQKYFFSKTNQQSEIYELMERLRSYEGGNKLNHAQTTEVSSVGHWSTVNQNLNNPQILTEAERRSIYEGNLKLCFILMLFLFIFSGIVFLSVVKGFFIVDGF
ncbi:hypothetical protein Smp_114520 [Schistosoma mansoni]|uniref:hypothetical protein n=1 Tax=Schistosoma mansoni TaxID=6183 RepID=UPI00022DC13C|nr:hypothetical protein Smp_114520 [Schistosoma mansoni]|eukprot:XP_018648573.1 hypothetical protein Smp_114520 [Schistosoma mansoni]